LAALVPRPLRGEDAQGNAAPAEEFGARLARKQLQAKAAAAAAKSVLLIVQHDDIKVVFTATSGAAIPDVGGAADDEPRPPTRRITIAEASCEQMLYGKDRNAGTARCRLDQRLAQKIKFVDGLCELTERQRKKLELAGRGDIHRFFERVAEFRSTLLDIDGDPAGDHRALVAVVVERLKTSEPLRREVDSGLFEENSLFAKVLKTTLTPAQVKRYEQRQLNLPGS
jgi:hypothetical protein